MKINLYHLRELHHQLSAKFDFQNITHHKISASPALVASNVWVCASKFSINYSSKKEIPNMSFCNILTVDGFYWNHKAKTSLLFAQESYLSQIQFCSMVQLSSFQSPFPLERCQNSTQSWFLPWWLLGWPLAQNLKRKAQKSWSEKNTVHFFGVTNIVQIFVKRATCV